MTIRFEVTGEVDGLGVIKHTIRATSRGEAKARFRNAHSKHKVRNLSVKEL